MSQYAGDLGVSCIIRIADTNTYNTVLSDSATLEWHRKMEVELRKVHALEGEAGNEEEQGEERDEEDEEEEELRRLEDGDPDAEEILTQ